MADLFLDTSFALALALPSDQHADAAHAWSRRVQDAGRRLVTTTGVVLEIGGTASAQNRRQAAVRILDTLFLDPAIEVVDLHRGLLDRAFDLYRSHPDKEWGLVDCSSFVAMRERGLTEALTADAHFEQAGFRALLLDAP